MTEALQRFTADNTVNMLGLVAVLWAIWPLSCAVLGAQRGRAMYGFMQGFLWGPLGIPVVLMSTRKHFCPTCGQRTLSRPIEARALVSPARVSSSSSAPASMAPSGSAEPARVASPPVLPESAIAPPTWEASNPRSPAHTPARGPQDVSREEADKLLAWVNAE